MVTKASICLYLFSSLAFSDLLIRDVTIIDVVTGAELPKRSILTHDDRITAIGIEVHATKQAQIISGAGKFVIPGLWDMDVHLIGRDQLQLYPAYGVTGVRDMGSDFDRVVD